LGLEIRVLNPIKNPNLRALIRYKAVGVTPYRSLLKTSTIL